MELFYAYEADGRFCRLDADESGHCCRVLRHRAGDEIHVIDGLGTLLRCRLVDDNSKGAEAEVLEAVPGWGGHPYHLTHRSTRSGMPGTSGAGWIWRRRSPRSSR